jgi:hypothetical protein
MVIYFGSKGKHDIDNFSKLTLDAGNGILYLDDGQIQKMTVEKRYSKEKPRIELEYKSRLGLLNDNNCKELWDINNGRTLCTNCHRKNRVKKV